MERDGLTEEVVNALKRTLPLVVMASGNRKEGVEFQARSRKLLEQVRRALIKARLAGYNTELGSQ
jgi:hypothetical protein